MTSRIDETDLTPDHYLQYRLARFGLGGKEGRDGVRRAATHHGVTIRAWFYYESGARRPKRNERVKIARWLSLSPRDAIESPPIPEPLHEPTPDTNSTATQDGQTLPC